jgi:hypothetical protein
LLIIFLLIKISFMKKLHTLFLVFSITITVTATAQVNKGALFLGGNIAYSENKSETTGSSEVKNTSFTISPQVGVAVKDNLIAGVAFRFGSMESKETNVPGSQVTESQVYGGSFFLRKYKAIGKSGFSLFGQAELGADHVSGESKSSAIGYRQVIKSTVFSLDFAPGISYAINKKLQLETGFNEAIAFSVSNQKSTNYTNNTVTSTSKARGFGVSTSLNSFTSSFILDSGYC